MKYSKLKIEEIHFTSDDVVTTSGLVAPVWPPPLPPPPPAPDPEDDGEE
ncbi:hypothetical protein [Gemelliphila palaticanis]|uniref:Uncharacterized protein n=1 Tax=Gemelliphila palaticanis TaxID=81950 RepID=A0ABX2SZQ8_9BACL|nr:hypothetical protein [Gemella palaticanis]MBF0715937.1 hypothetical protein [Gemella palaticanis]NYS47867.1 hypothetical protein [Gemella palaticanis]